MFPTLNLSIAGSEVLLYTIMDVKTSLVLLTLAAFSGAGSLADVKHVVMIMFENRSFDHVGKMPVSSSFQVDLFSVLWHDVRGSRILRS